MMNPPSESVGPSFSAMPYVIYLSCLVLIIILSFELSPSPEGHGTHRQLGFPPCGFLTVTGYPCPSCGLTTSFSYLARGHGIKSLQTQPFGAVLFITLLAIGIIAVVGLVKRIPVSNFIESIVFERIQVLLLVLFLVSWIYKIIIMAF
ncbi:DUF2752 domain-containing protein [bacterium]|nr:DUF2752 domain-containing protein [bacterium]